MINIAFFLSVFGSCSWLIFCYMYISERLHGVSFKIIGALDMLIYTVIMVLPLIIIWSIFVSVFNFWNHKEYKKRLNKITEETKKNQKYSDLIAQALIENEKSIKAGFVLNNFNLFVSEINETISDISNKLEADKQKIQDAWVKVNYGEKWALAKMLLETLTQNSKFTNSLKHMAKADDSLSQPILEFCVTYENMLLTFEKCDSDIFFTDILKNGILSKIYNIIVKIVDRPEEAYNETNDDVFELEPKVIIQPKQERVIPTNNVSLQISPDDNLKRGWRDWSSSLFNKTESESNNIKKPSSSLIDKDSFYMFIGSNKNKKDSNLRKEPQFGTDSDDEEN